MENSKTIKVGIAGLGTVGGGTFGILSDSFAEIRRKIGLEVLVSHIGSRREPKIDLSKHNFPLASEVRVSQNIFDLLEDDELQIIVELIGGTDDAKKLIEGAIAKGKHVVTANKALIAEFGNELFAKAHAANVVLAYESAIAGGIPIVKTLREGLASNQIQSVAGIINGTGNFILTEMKDKGRDFADVLKEAQELGYAEADPTFDVEGIDAAHKLTILAAIAFGVPLNFAKTFTEGISKVTPIDLAYASEFGYKIKHLGIARKQENGIEMRVHPTLVPENNLIAKVDGVMNAVLVQGDAVGEVLCYGPGAGAGPTGSAVVADILDISRSIAGEQKQAGQVAGLGFQPDAIGDANFIAINDLETSYYLRVQVSDEPGVIANISKLLSDQGISIEGVFQKEVLGDKTVPIIIITKSVTESKINDVLAKIEQLDSTHGEVIKIRLERLEN